MVTTLPNYLKPRKLLKQILKKEIEEGLTEIQKSDYIRSLDFDGMGLNLLGSSDILIEAAIHVIKDSLLNQVKISLATADSINKKNLHPGSKEHTDYVNSEFEKFLSHDLAKWCLNEDHKNFKGIKELTYGVFISRVSVYSKLMNNWEKGMELLDKECPDFLSDISLDNKRCNMYEAVVRATYPNPDKAYSDYQMELKYQKEILDIVNGDRSILWLEEIKIPFTNKTIKISGFGADPAQVGQMLFPIISASYFYTEQRLKENVEGIYQTAPVAKITS